MSPIQLPLDGFGPISVAYSATTTSGADARQWNLNKFQVGASNTLTGGSPEYVRITNVGSVVAYVAISNDVNITAVIPTNNTFGNTIPVLPNSSIDIQLFNQSGLQNSMYNNGTDSCFISCATSTGTTTLMLNAVQIN